MADRPGGRWFMPLLSWDHHRLSLGFGPSAGLRSETLGIFVPHDPDKEVDESDLYAVLFFNLEVAYELRASWGGMLRFGAGGYVTLWENMSGLCDEVPSGEKLPVNDCHPPHMMSGPEAARLPAAPFVHFDGGWAF